MLLRIAIVLSSISIMSDARSVFAIAVATTALGSILSLNGYLLLFRLPFLH